MNVIQKITEMKKGKGGTRGRGKEKRTKAEDEREIISNQGG